MRLSTTRFALLSISLLMLGFLVGRIGDSGDSSASVPSDGGVPAAQAEPTIWTCSMHPQIRLPEPGLCPLCSMKLVPASNANDSDDLGPRTLQVSEAAMALADIETAPVERRTVAHEINMVGKVAYDETRLAYITSWVAGRLDRLFVDYTGVSVRPGDHLVEIYSPTLYSAQQELLQAIATVKRLDDSSLDIVRSTSDQTVISSREKLRLYGLSEEQIQGMVERGVPDEHVTIRAPIGGIVVHKLAVEGMYVKEGTQIYTIADLSKVWVVLDAYEVDLAWLRFGQDVEFRVEAYPGEVFHGRIAFIDPLLDDRTRTVKVRMNVDNSDGRLKPDMFVSSTTQAVLTEHGKVVDEDLEGKWMCPMHPEIIADEPGECPECGMELAQASELGFVTEPVGAESLVIPDTAVLVTGKRGVVYVRLPGYEKPTFEGRVVELGPRAGHWYIVHEGLEEGELVVVKGNFKIDSELQIRAKPSMMSPGGGAPPAGHHHGGGSTQATAGSSPRSANAVAAPAAFQAQLGALVEAYLGLQQDLAVDTDDGASAAAIVEQLGAVDMSLLAGEGHMAWMKQLPDLKLAAEKLASAAGIEQRRVLLSPFTAHLIRALKTFGYERGDGAVGIFHCPMALGSGADWIQQGEQTSNPYLGLSMPRCGSLQELLKAGS